MHAFLLAIYIIRSLVNDAVPNVKLRSVERDDKINMRVIDIRGMCYISHVLTISTEPSILTVWPTRPLIEGYWRSLSRLNLPGRELTDHQYLELRVLMSEALLLLLLYACMTWIPSWSHVWGMMELSVEHSRLISWLAWSVVITRHEIFRFTLCLKHTAFLELVILPFSDHVVILRCFLLLRAGLPKLIVISLISFRAMLERLDHTVM
jgi:hypothetical protein